MPIIFFIPPIIERVRKKIAERKGIEYKPLLPRTMEKVNKIKNKLKIKKNGKSI